MMSLVSPSSHFSKYSHPPLSPYLGQLRQPCRRLLIELEALLILLILLTLPTLPTLPTLLTLLCAYCLEYCYVLASNPSFKQWNGGGSDGALFRRFSSALLVFFFLLVGPTKEVQERTASSRPRRRIYTSWGREEWGEGGGGCIIS